MNSKAVSQISKTLFQTGNCNIFVLHGVFFGRYVQIKCFFSDKKTAVKSETHFSTKAIKNSCCKVLKENSIVGRSWGSANLLIAQHYSESANGDVPLMVENVIFLVSLSSRGTHVLSL